MLLPATPLTVVYYTATEANKYYVAPSYYTTGSILQHRAQLLHNNLVTPAFYTEAPKYYSPPSYYTEAYTSYAKPDNYTNAPQNYATASYYTTKARSTTL
ncbi:Uncharacterized protein APZ42_027010 [Daphnia magna]|uniref:Uncharacterized protein n=1 Tax=Daphnia magna TaxID=35525 RepID=A0A162D9X0_9CRUS|nr:Uncharacterized protein APZ42_027010 [Daphnia magna]